MSPRIGLDLAAILQAATDIADTHGIEEVTLATLAKKLKIRPPSLYNHVEGLHGLRKQLAIYGLKKLHNALMQATVGRAGDDAVRALSEAYVAFVRAHPGLYEATLQAPDPRDSEIQQVASEIVLLVVRLLHAYGLEDDLAIHAVRGLRSILHGFASLEQKGGFGIPLDLNVSFRLMIDSFLAGIHAMKQNTSLNSKIE